VAIIGNLTADWEMRYTAGGSAIANTSIAVNRKWKDKDGEQKEEVSFIDLTAFGKQAETLALYTKRGNPIHVNGRLKQDRWEHDGQKRSKVLVIVEGFQFLGGKKDEIDVTTRREEAAPEQQSLPVGEGAVPF
jgi:single-strand DNA-binding protein